MDSLEGPSAYHGWERGLTCHVGQLQALITASSLWICRRRGWRFFWRLPRVGRSLAPVRNVSVSVALSNLTVRTSVLWKSNGWRMVFCGCDDLTRSPHLAPCYLGRYKYWPSAVLHSLSVLRSDFLRSFAASRFFSPCRFLNPSMAPVIERVVARQIFDSRGNPTVEVSLSFSHWASVWSGSWWWWWRRRFAPSPSPRGFPPAT